MLCNKRRADRSKGGNIYRVPFRQAGLGGGRAVRHRWLDLIPPSHTDRRADGTAMFCQTIVRDHEFPQWRLDVVEVDVGDEAVDGRDGRRSVAMHIALPLDQIREIGEPAGHRGVSFEAADAQVTIAKTTSPDWLKAGFSDRYQELQLFESELCVKRVSFLARRVRVCFPADMTSGHTSTFALSELSWMNSRRGSTTSPINFVKMSSASSTSLTLTCNSERSLVSSVVVQSCSGFISPRPL
jgi:hypothetical protein